MQKTVLITGGAKGIGEAIAREFSKKGYKVIINYNKSQEKALILADEIGAEAICGDVSKWEDAKKIVEFAASFTGKIDVLVNNAGVSLPQQLITDTTDEEWDNLFAVNVKGCFNCSKAALFYMINEHSGSIVNISSVWGITGGSCEVAYSATKSAVIGFTKALAKEVGPSGIRVNCVAPGVIGTDMNAHLSESDMDALKEETPLGVIGTTLDVARAVIYVAEAEFVTGQVISPNGGMVI